MTWSTRVSTRSTLAPVSEAFGMTKGSMRTNFSEMERSLPPARELSPFRYPLAGRPSRIRVASKYTHIARQHFADKGVHVDLIKLYGSMELAPLTGLADAIVDLVSTGSTLKANHLVEVERIMDISARLVVNQAALKLKREPMRRLIDAFARAAG